MTTKEIIDGLLCNDRCRQLCAAMETIKLLEEIDKRIACIIDQTGETQRGEHNSADPLQCGWIASEPPAVHFPVNCGR